MDSAYYRDMEHLGTDEYRCPSINPWDAEDRCHLRGDDPHLNGHSGLFRGRNIYWDHSPISVADDAPDRWVKS